MRTTQQVTTRASAPGDDDGALAAFGIAASPGGQVVGAVEVDMFPRAIADVQQRTTREIATAVAAIGLVGLLAVVAIAAGAVRRVRRVAEAAGKVAQGKLDTTLAVRGSDELGRLERDFNQMSASLVQQHERLVDQGRRLADKEALAALGRATAVIAHELRNPLGIVLGASEIAKNPDKPMRAREQAAGIIDEEVRRLERTLDDLLSYARPRTPELVDVDLRSAVSKAVSRAASPGGPAFGKVVIVDGIDVVVRADEGFVQQIVWNLVQNAAQAGAAQIRLLVSQEEVGFMAQVRVSDDGPGLTPEARDTLFQPFATTKQRGTGLGLAASRRMAQDMGGDLALVVDADAAAGATFLLSLPRVLS